MKNILDNKVVSTITRGAHKSARIVTKHSPLLLTVAGVLGMGYTAYLAYKSADKVKKITEDVEKKRETEEEVNELQGRQVGALSDRQIELIKNFEPVKRTDVIRDLAGAVAAPVTVGVLSVCSIALGYYIQNNRLMQVAAALTTATAENAYYRNKMEKEYGKDRAAEFYGLETDHVETVADDKGQTHDIEVKKPARVHRINGDVFSESEDYVEDDKFYNLRLIKSVEEEVSNKIGRNGWVALNDLRDKLGLERIKEGGVLGWTTLDHSFYIDTTEARTTVDMVDKETGEIRPTDRLDIILTWPTPRYIYDEIEYDGRYSK